MEDFAGSVSQVMRKGYSNDFSHLIDCIEPTHNETLESYDHNNIQ
ncbi:hypothetical protein N748_17055 [Legionella pneumophila str. 121004]|nr:hypothetical protein LPC_0049 [Legionella pneumophila str. Corby]ADG23292.1 hypothetical protein lpa_00063 [Legionella pneumophila 2300/99 Alcoy]AGH55288.1 hypothetical protein LPE509_03197 [Legionella pneumophila subsp. pneumophila LPE509]ERB39908.1 hypothetical protein N748_17055 [Legionella pneumophila str. 121004]ERH42053.1 hypothetical protein N750_15180 [Legionella pneumophila str. Leg01/53]ERH46588.1 hypothetical protein N751_07065 [Legionella pneumophila str. Leg01/11]ERI48679.1 hy